MFALSFGKSLTGIVTIASFSVLSYMLPEKQDYAAFRQTIMAFMIATPFMTMGLKEGLFYFLPAENERKRGRVLDALVIVCAMGAVFAAFIFFGGNEILAQRFSNPQVAGLLLLLIPLSVANAISLLFPPILTVLDRIYSLTIFNIVTRILIGVCTIFPVLIWVSPTSALAGQMVGTILTCVAGLALLFWYLPKDDWRPNFGAMKEVYKFSLPLGIAGLVGILNLQLDKLVVTSMCTPEQFAVFSNGAIEIPLIGVLTGSIVAVLMVEMRTAVSENRTGDALDLFRKTSIKTSYALFPAAIFLFIFAGPFISTVFSSKYSDAAAPFRVYLLLIPIRTVSFGALMVALGLNKVILFRSLITLGINLLVSIFLVSVMGPIGAAVATVLVVMVWVVPCCIFFIAKSTDSSFWKVLPIKHFGEVSLQLAFFTVGMVGLAFFIKDLSSLLQITIATFVAGVWMFFWWNGRLYNLKKILARLRAT